MVNLKEEIEKISLNGGLHGMVSMEERFGELNVELRPESYLSAMAILRDHLNLQFDQMIDLCGVDRLDDAAWAGPGGRFVTVVHLLSTINNWRVRVTVAAQNDDIPVVDSINDLWSAANWYERESFDLMGIIYEGHPDLRRILTDYGFIGHPFRKDFPISGHVEMRYDPEQKRVIYQPVTIEPRENIPRVIREPHYAADA